MRRALLVLTALLAQPAAACPTIATGTPSQLSFDTAQVVLTHVDGRTTFSVSINPAGDPQDFALVLPVPSVLAESDIRTLDNELFRQLDAYTAPRRVTDAGCGYQSYVPCPETDADSDADADSDSDSDSESTVDVEASYLIGSYEISILSAEESSDLQVWLDVNGYYLPAGSEERLAEYIAAGMYFLVAKVSPEATAADGSPLMPLQVGYDAEFMSIPLRLAALAAVEAQDMVVYTLVDASKGQVGISNYPEFDLADTCIWGTEVPGDFAADQAARFDAAFAEAGPAAWTVEFSQFAGDCNPCTSENPFYYYDGDALSELGFVPSTEAGAEGWPWITRIHMRYDRDSADADLMLYASGIQSPDLLSYADYTESNRDCIGFYCDGTPVEPPPETVYEEDCDDEPTGDGGAGDDGSDGSAPTELEEADMSAKSGCAHSGPAGLGLWALGLAALLRRRAGTTSPRA